MRTFFKSTKDREDPEFLSLIRTLPCCVCKTEKNIEAHHLLYAPLSEVISLGFDFFRAGKRRAPDMFSVPLCVEHHRQGKEAVHKIGSEHHFGELWILALDLYENRDDRDYCYSRIQEYEKI